MQPWTQLCRLGVAGHEICRRGLWSTFLGEGGLMESTLPVASSRVASSSKSLVELQDIWRDLGHNFAGLGVAGHEICRLGLWRTFPGEEGLMESPLPVTSSEVASSSKTLFELQDI